MCIGDHPSSSCTLPDPRGYLTRLEDTQTPDPTTPTAQADRDSLETFNPRYYFFYGTLMDADVLQAVTEVEEYPILHEATVSGYIMKIWNDRHPAVLPTNQPTDIVKGKVWLATTVDQCLRIQMFDTVAYRPANCIVETSDGKRAPALVSEWAQGAHSDELSDGTFDLELWQARYKKDMLGADSGV